MIVRHRKEMICKEFGGRLTGGEEGAGDGVDGEG